MYLTQYELLQYIRHLFIEGDWLTSLEFMGVVHIIRRFIQLTRYFRFIGGYRFYQFTALPFSIATVFSRVHQGSKRVEADDSRRRHQYSPVYRRLANDNKFKTAMPGIHPLGVHLVESLGWITNFLKIRFISNSSNQIFGLQFDLRVGLVFSTQRKSIVFLERQLPC